MADKRQQQADSKGSGYVRSNLYACLIPFILYCTYRFMVLPQGVSGFQEAFFGFFFYFMMLVAIIYFLFYKTEVIVAFLDGPSGKLRFIFNILAIVFFTSLMFASYYWCLYSINADNFTGVAGEGFLQTFPDFIFYSWTLFMMNGAGSIEPQTLFAKLFVLTEVLTSFIMIVMILANYEGLRDPFNQHLNKAKKEQ